MEYNQTDQRYAEARKVTLVGSVVDLVLGVGKIIAGYIGSSQALIADGIHSLSDLVTDVLKTELGFNRNAAAPVDHAYLVFDGNGPVRSEYRRYNITGITPGDDYAAMAQVLQRRYGKALDDNKIPDVIFIDGGKGQLGMALDVFHSLNVEWDKSKPLLIGIAKGADRKAGLETLFFVPEGEGIALPADSPALHVIQHIRDDSHNHAITGHRQRRAKVRTTSALEEIEGVGPKRRQVLLKYMGGIQPLLNASVEEIAQVPGISIALAEKIHNALKH